MNDLNKYVFEPVNEPIKSHSQLTACIQIPDFNALVADHQVSLIQMFYERVAQEIYNTRKKNYTWGFGVIEPQFLNMCDRIVLVSALYNEEELADLNSVIFKLFVEFNNIILSAALHMHLPLRGMIRMGQVYRGSVRSRKPALVSGKDPLILADLLKVFSFSEIFPNGYSDGMIPAVEIPYHFGEIMAKSFDEISELESIGIFLPSDYATDKCTEVTILSNMLTETVLGKQKIFACNWKEWMKGQSNCSPDNIIAFAESEAGNGKGIQARRWQSMLDYSAQL
jgi:hypothetical protein